MASAQEAQRSNLTSLIRQMVVGQVMRSGVMRSFAPEGLFLVWFAAVWAVLGSGFLLYAGFVTLQLHYSHDVAAYLVAAVAFGFSMIATLTGLQIMKRKARHRQEHDSDLARTVGDLCDVIGDELESPIRENPKTALMVASLAGFFAGNRVQ